MANQIVRPSGTIDELVAGSAVVSGQFKFLSGGNPVVYDRDAAVGEWASLKTGVDVLVDKETTSDTFAVGATVYGDSTTQDADTTDTGDGTLGVCVKASSATDTQVLVAIPPL